MAETFLIESRSLLPPAWASAFAGGPVRTFNPGLLREGDGWIFAYRVVGPDDVRRIGLCRLDRNFRVVAGSPVAWSDRIRFPAAAGYAERARTWLADPRLYRLAGRLYVYWNSGWHEPQNHQFLQEIDAAHLSPIGAPRELTLRGARQSLEKNWTLFGDGPFYVLYSLDPLRVLSCSLAGTGAIECAEVAAHPAAAGAYARAQGELRGGAPAQRVGDDYFAIGHSISGVAGSYRYVAAACRFAAASPFTLRGVPGRPLDLGTPPGSGRTHPPLNPAIAAVTYPCGAVQEDGRWHISYGIDDERCAIAMLPHAEVVATLTNGGF